MQIGPISVAVAVAVGTITNQYQKCLDDIATVTNQYTLSGSLAGVNATDDEIRCYDCSEDCITCYNELLESKNCTTDVAAAEMPRCVGDSVTPCMKRLETIDF